MLFFILAILLLAAVIYGIARHIIKKHDGLDYTDFFQENEKKADLSPHKSAHTSCRMFG
ncbi:hypothetical protein [Acutalibacter caecimuris]|uniref:hypothetical protein n=1 Tax=Acutalibacter caecimuris TaxID=3093657 RepID=UPI002AC9C3CE|nr:hypothetical protein [Acutalibacter sp. M00118]